MTQDAYIAALLRERDGYIAVGRADRAAEVEAELERNGVTVDRPVERATAPAAEKRAPRKRAAK